MREIFKKSILILAIFVIWQVVCELEIFTPYILPSPIATFKTMHSMSLSGELATHTIISFKRIFAGYALSFALALVLGGIAALLPKIIIIILASFFPMFLSIQKGLTSCDVKLIEVGKIFGFSKFEIFYKIILKSALKDIFVGMRIGFGYAMRAIIGAEMIAASSGLGYLILDAEELSRADRIFLLLIAKFSLLRGEK